jgi:multicomponent K+:H+ antiporter subunit D
MVGSTLALSALFMLVELIDRGRMAGADVLAVTMEAYGDFEEDELIEDEEVGIPIPGKLAVLGISFIACGLLIVGLPPFSGFIAKFAIMAGIIGAQAGAPGEPISGSDWAIVALLIVSGLAVMVAMLRGGINTFWATREDMNPSIHIVELAPIVVLIVACMALTVFAGPAMTYFEATAAELHNPIAYVYGVIEAAPNPMSGRGGVQ